MSDFNLIELTEPLTNLDIVRTSIRKTKGPLTVLALGPLHNLMQVCL